MKSLSLTLSFILLGSLLHTLKANDFEKALNWYEQRAEGAIECSAKPDNINNAIALFEQVYKSKDHELQAGIYLMRSYIWKARFTQESKSDKRKTLQLAKDIGDHLVPLYPNNKDLRFEYISAMGQWGAVLGVFRAAKEGVVDKVRTQMNALIALDIDYRNGVPKRALAALHLRVPKIPFIISWPSKKEALEMTTEVVNKYPNDIGNNFYHAEALIANGQKEAAIPYLEKALTFAPKPKYLLEDRHLLLEVRQMLADISNQ